MVVVRGLRTGRPDTLSSLLAALQIPDQREQWWARREEAVQWLLQHSSLEDRNAIESVLNDWDFGDVTVLAVGKGPPAENRHIVPQWFLDLRARKTPVRVDFGPGTELKALLKYIGIVATPNCSCNARAAEMDRREAETPGWCAENIETILDWLKEQADARGLPFVRMGAKVLVRRAISNARKKAAQKDNNK
jgi:hypothetical protein